MGPQDPILCTFPRSFRRNDRGGDVGSGYKIAAARWENNQLGCAIGDPLFFISRRRTVDGRAVLVEQFHIVAARCPGLLDYPLDRSITDLMAEKFGIIEHRAQIGMRPTALSDSSAKALGVAVGTPGLYLSRAILDQWGDVVEFDQEFWRHYAIDICVSAAGSVE